MSESRQQEISDYNTLSNEKRRIVRAVIIAALVIGSIYLAAKSFYVPNDSIETHDVIGKVPAQE
jgi:hypothetical protein